MKFRILLSVILLLFAESSFSQRRGPRGTGGEEFPLVSIEYHQFHSPNQSAARIDVGYRIPAGFFVYVRDTAASAPTAYVGHGELAIEILDRKGISRARTIRQIEQETNDPAPEALRDRFIEGAVSTSLAPGDYTLTVELTDRQSERHYFDNKRSFVVSQPPDSSCALSDLFFLKTMASDRDSLLSPLNWDMTIPLGQRVMAALLLRTDAGAEPVQSRLTLVRLNIPDRPNDTIQAGPLTAPAHLRRGGLTPLLNDSTIAYRFADSGGAPTCLLLQPIATDSLEEGSYIVTLETRIGSRSARIDRQFAVRWITKPASLRNPETAIAAMKYILSKDDFDKMRGGDQRHRMQEFRDYWRKHDPTPGTAVNELEAEYFRRADYAMAHFGSLREPNGIESDRGMIYLVYGPPTSIQHDVLPGGPPRETWTYASLKRDFVFTDPTKQGNYMLVTEEGDSHRAK